jgi:hypothetical protein
MSIDPYPEQPIEDWMLDQREAMAAHIEEGFAQTERGFQVVFEDIDLDLQAFLRRD